MFSVAWQTTLENVVFGPKLRGTRGTTEIEAEANNLLDKVGLSEFKEKYPIQLSGGMQRRAELARAMINHPLVMIMDEPFRGLDAMSRELMQEFFVRLFEENHRTVENGILSAVSAHAQLPGRVARRSHRADDRARRL